MKYKIELLAILTVFAVSGFITVFAVDSYIIITEGIGQVVNSILVEDSGGIDLLWVNSAGGIFASIFVSTNADPADAGTIRLGNAEIVAWEASPAGTDLTITSDASENLVLNSGWNDIDFNLNPLVDIVSIANSASFVNFLNSINVTSGDINMTGTSRFLDVNTNRIKGSMTCTNGQILEYNSATDIWACATDDTGGALDIISEGDSNVEVIDAGTGTVEVDIDGSNQYTFTGTELDVQANNIIDVTDFYQTGDIADAGNFRLTNAQQLCSEASPAGTDACITLLDATENFIFGSGYNNIDFGSNPITNGVLGGTLDASGNTIDNVAIQISNDADPADAGAVRFGNAETIAWEANPASTDLTITADASENFVWDTAWINLDLNSNPVLDFIAGALIDMSGNTLDNAGIIADNSGDEADAGFLRMGNTAIIGWEASPAGTDLTITSDASENLVLNTGWNDIDFNLNPLVDVVSIANTASFVNFVNSINVTSGDINMTGTSRFLDINTNKIKGSMTCANGQILEYSTTTDTWACGTDDTSAGSPTDIIAEGDSNVEVIDLGTGKVEVDVDGSNQFNFTSTLLDFQGNELRNYVRNVETITTTDTLNADNDLVILNPSTTAFTVTLPAVSGTAGLHYEIFYISPSGGVVTIDGNGAETINEVAGVTMEYQYSKYDIWSTGSVWIAQYTETMLSPEQQIIAIDDFMGGATTSTTTGTHGELGWTMIGVGTETGVPLDSVVEHAGVKRVGTTATSGDDANMFLSGTVSAGAFDPDDDFDLTYIVSISTITSITARVGFALTTTSNNEETSENALFLFDPAVDPSWRCRTRSAGGTDQSTDSTIDVSATSWYKLRIIGKDSGNVRFYINDVNRCNHSTQVPTNPVTPVVTVDTTSASARNIDVDYFRGSWYLGAR